MANNNIYQLSDDEIAQVLREEIATNNDPNQLVKLTLECEAYIVNIKGFRSKLKSTSFFRIVTKYCTKKQLTEAQLNYLEIAHQVQKQIVNHIVDLYDKMERLIVGADLQFEEIRGKLSELDNRVNVSEWLTSLGYLKTNEGIQYKKLPDSAKVLVIVRDLFQMKIRGIKPVESQIHRAWTDIGLPDSIDLVTFLADFCKNIRYADLLFFYEYDYSYPQLSQFGRCLAKIIMMTEDNDKIECIKACYDNVSSTDTIGPSFCEQLLTDLMKLHEQYQEMYALNNSDVDAVIADVIGPQLNNLTILLVLNKESSKSFVYQNKAWKAVDSADEESLCLEYHPNILVIPDRFEKANFPTNKYGVNKVLRLNDFAAHLWFRSQINNGTFQDNKILCVFDFYYKKDDKEMYGQQYVRAYQNNTYIGKCRMHDKMTIGHMRDNLNKLHGKNPYYAFRTFCGTMKPGTIKRLEDIRVYYELESTLNLLCGTNSDEELKLLLEHFNISLEEIAEENKLHIG